MKFDIKFWELFLKNKTRLTEGSMNDNIGSTPKIITNINGKLIKAYYMERVIINKDFEKKLIRLLEIANYSYSLYEGAYVKIAWSQEGDLLIAFNAIGMSCLGVIRESLSKDIGLMHGFEITIKESKHMTGGMYWPQYTKHTLIAILEIPKFENISVLSPKELKKMYEDINPIVSKTFIKDLKHENIKYSRENNKYVLVDFTDCLSLINGVEFSFKKFICEGTPYTCNGRPITFEEYKFLLEMTS